MNYKNAPVNMENILNYRDDNVHLSVEVGCQAPPYGSTEYYKIHGYSKVSGLLNQLEDTEEELRKFCSYYLGLSVEPVSSRTFAFDNSNLHIGVKDSDVTIICQLRNDATLWIKTHQKEIHQISLKERDLLIVDNRVKLFRRKPNFISRFVDRYSTINSQYIQTLLFYGNRISV